MLTRITNNRVPWKNPADGRASRNVSTAPNTYLKRVIPNKNKLGWRGWGRARENETMLHEVCRHSAHERMEQCTETCYIWNFFNHSFQETRYILYNIIFNVLFFLILKIDIS